MGISPQVAGLAFSVVSGAVKLGKRIDEIAAEEAAIRSNQSIPFPTVVLDPLVKELKAALRELRDETAGTVPDPLGDDRDRITELVNRSGVRDELVELCRKYGLLTKLGVDAFSPDAEFERALRARSDAWDLADEDVRNLTFFVAAGEDFRTKSTAFRIGATVLDVVAEVAAANTRHFVDHEPTRKLVETVLTRFSEPDLGGMAGWGEVLRSALRVTLNAVIDERESLAGNREWVERTLSALARARSLAANGDDFVLGLLRGEGVNQLVRGVLSEGADYLSEGDEEVWEAVVADVLREAAARAEGSPGFEAFFAESWHLLVGAGLASLEEHGPRLLDPEDEVLKATLTAAVGALADSFGEGPPTGETLVSAVEAAVAVFADPDLLDEAVRDAWVREMIASVATVIRDEGLRKAFTQPALERYVRSALGVLSRHPAALGADGALPGALVSSVLGKMAEADALAPGPLADAAVEGALTAIAEKPGLLDFEYASAVGELAGALARRVAAGGIGSVEAEAVLADALGVVATNERLFLNARDGLANAVVDAVLDAAGEGEGLLAGAALVAAVRGILEEVARTGLGLPEDLAALEARVKEVLAAGLAQASDDLGRRLATGDVPVVLVALVERLASLEDFPEPDSPEFAELYEDLMADLAA